MEKFPSELEKENKTMGMKTTTIALTKGENVDDKMKYSTNGTILIQIHQFHFFPVQIPKMAIKHHF